MQASSKVTLGIEMEISGIALHVQDPVQEYRARAVLARGHGQGLLIRECVTSGLNLNLSLHKNCIVEFNI